jgi:hypothetical protein
VFKCTLSGSDKSQCLFVCKNLTELNLHLAVHHGVDVSDSFGTTADASRKARLLTNAADDQSKNCSGTIWAVQWPKTGDHEKWWEECLSSIGTLHFCTFCFKIGPMSDEHAREREAGRLCGSQGP